jgi:hypothetical protein
MSATSRGNRIKETVAIPSGSVRAGREKLAKFLLTVIPDSPWVAGGLY